MTRLRALLSFVFRLSDHRHLGLISAGVAFLSMLAFFPAVAALIAIWGFVADPADVAAQLARLEDFLPAEAYDLLTQTVGGLVSANVSVFGWTTAISLGAALWSARAGVAALIRGLNAIFGVENRAGLRHQLLAMLLTLSLVGVALAALLAGMVVPLVLAFAPLGPWEAQLVTLARWAIAPVVTVLGIGLIYRYGPNLHPRPPLLSPGLAVAVMLWLGASEGFSIYLGNFGDYNRIYGSIGAVVALQMWFYLSAYAILLGAAVNAGLAEVTGQPVRDQ